MLRPRLSPNQQLIANWRERVQQVLDEKGWSQRHLSLTAGLGPTTARNLLLVADDVNLKTLAKLADALGVSVVWLATGCHALADASVDDRPRAINVLPIHSPQSLAARTKPVGSFPILADDYPDDVRGLRVEDQSMVPKSGIFPPPSSVVMPGDVALFSAARSFNSGHLVVALTPRGAVVRRAALRQADEVELIANNPLFSNVIVKPKDVLGSVVSIHRRTSAV